MMLSNLTLFNVAHQKMSWLSQRQAVTAHNIANADTPNYRSQDLDPLNFKRMLPKLKQVSVARTSAAHQKGTRQPPDFRVQNDKKKSVYEVNPDGNTVVLEEQMGRVADNRMQYQYVANLMEKNMKMFRTAIGKRE